MDPVCCWSFMCRIQLKIECKDLNVGTFIVKGSCGSNMVFTLVLPLFSLFFLVIHGGDKEIMKETSPPCHTKEEWKEIRRPNGLFLELYSCAKEKEHKNYRNKPSINSFHFLGHMSAPKKKPKNGWHVVQGNGIWAPE